MMLGVILLLNFEGKFTVSFHSSSLQKNGCLVDDIFTLELFTP